MKQSNKTLIITGASTGIGEATARQAAEAGWNVVLAARSMDKLRALESELGTECAFAHQCNVADWESQQTLKQAALERFGTIDAVFANAGFSKGSSFMAVKTSQTNGVKWCWSMCSEQLPQQG